MNFEKWTFLVPFKDSRFAKSRLDVEQPLRREVALSMLYDTVEALLSVRDVQRVFVICGRGEDVLELRAWPKVEIVIESSPGLNEAIRHGENTARAADPAVRLAVCPADLPTLDPDELARVLTACIPHARCVVPDRDGSGTTLLTSAVAVALDPAFGPGSLAAHVARGAERLQLPQRSTLRHDVDYVSDLDGVWRKAPLSRTAQLWASTRVVQ
jgi:2-phospho-L-lactate guanylyltransferase